MAISITQTRIPQKKEWDRIWQQCSYATYFQSREWAEVWEQYTGGTLRPAPQLIEFSDGTRALLPISYTRSIRGLVKDYISSPAGTFGGWISSDRLESDHAQLLSRYLIRKIGNIWFMVNPYNQPMVESTRLIRNAIKVEKLEEKNDETQALNLREGFESILKMWRRKKASIVRKADKARRAGVIIKAAQSLSEWKEYFECYEDSIRRWDKNASSTYSWELFSLLFQRNSPNIKLWLAMLEDKVIAGALCFYANKHSVYWHGAAFSKYFNLRPVNLLMFEIIKSACQEKYEWFDFNPSGGHEGVKRFKKSFKCESLPAPAYDFTSNSKKILVSLSKVKSTVFGPKGQRFADV